MNRCGQSWIGSGVEYLLCQIQLRCEVTESLSIGRDSRSEGLCLPNSQAFVIHKEEGAIPAVVNMGDDNRAAEGKSKLILLVRSDRLIRRVEEIFGVELLIAQELVHAPVKLIGS